MTNMKTSFTLSVVALAMLAFFTRCGNVSHHPANDTSKTGCDNCGSSAIFAEFARGANKSMKDGLNRRVFNVTESLHGKDIALHSDGSVTLQPGSYRISGFSMVTMQTSMAASFQPQNYPGYCLVYLAKDEQNPEILKRQIGIGTPATSAECNPSLFDLVYTCDTATAICVGHQSGNNLPADKIFLSVFKVDKDTSNYHVFSRMAVTKLY
jgi:hypothetical protein